MNFKFRTLSFVIISLVLLMGIIQAGYKQKPLPDLNAEDCPSFQQSQGLHIGAVPYIGKKETRLILDTKELHNNGIVPVLLVIHNKSEVPVQFDLQGILAISIQGIQSPALPPAEVISTILGKDVRTAGSLTIDLTKLGNMKHADLMVDFREKSLQSDVVAPGDLIRKVVFFRLGTDPGTVEKSQIYISRIYDLKNGQELIFFEFPLKLQVLEKKLP